MGFKKVLFSVVILASINSTTAAGSNFQCTESENLKSIGTKLNGKIIKECVQKNTASNIFESKWGILSTERRGKDTSDYNCHGLAYYVRNGWINYPNHLLYNAIVKKWFHTSINKAKKNDRGSLFVHDPKRGNWNINGKKYYISHSWIFDEDYKNSSSNVRSKYGKMGEYVHSYSKMLPVYKQTKNDFVVVLPFSKASINQKSAYNSMKTFHSEKTEFVRFIENVDLKNVNFTIDIDLNTEELNRQTPQSYEALEYQLNDSSPYYPSMNTEDIINSLNLDDFVDFLSASSELNKHGAIQKNKKLRELYNRHQSDEEVKNLLLSINVDSKLKKLVIEFIILLDQ